MTSEQRQETRDVHASGPAADEYSVDCDDETRTKTVDRARAVESDGQEGESQDILRLPRAV